MNIVIAKDEFKKRLFSGRIVYTNAITEPFKAFLTECLALLVLKIGEFIHNFRSVAKINFELACEYVLIKGQQEQLQVIYFQTKMTQIWISQDFKVWYAENVMDPSRIKMKFMNEIMEKRQDVSFICN